MMDLWERFGFAVLMVFCGAVLLLFPDSAVALVTKLFAWILIAAGIYNVIKILVNQGSEAGTWIWTVLYFAVGGYMLSHPMVITDLVSRLLGTFLMIHGFGELRRSVHSSAKVLGGITAAVGFVLVLMPRTLTDTLLGIVGIALIIVGVINFVGKLNRKLHLKSGDDKIIDADE